MAVERKIKQELDLCVWRRDKLVLLEGISRRLEQRPEGAVSCTYSVHIKC